MTDIKTLDDKFAKTTSRTEKYRIYMQAAEECAPEGHYVADMMILDSGVNLRYQKSNTTTDEGQTHVVPGEAMKPSELQERIREGIYRLC